ncbi:MAG TPA: helix-turn-helix transcriptional regulator [Gemmatales bacterium]|nr:helix-turn-helix transcriptional regulator [Gemmatales bacterium]HMP60528.1 helix-turn-helix transcriptional regulator [Gemmatales bacterium]
MPPTLSINQKIALLVRERGWTQSEFAERAGLNRLTARKILLDPTARLQAGTLHACASALGLTVHELVQTPVERLLSPATVPDSVARPSDAELQAEQPVLWDWLQRHPERAARFSDAELAELASLHGTGGPLTEEGVEHFTDLIARRRDLLHRVSVIASTDYLPLLEQLVELLYEKVQLDPKS